MGNVAEVVESLGRMPPGSAKIGCLTRPGAVRGEILWLLREESRKIAAMKKAAQQTGFCCGLVLQDNVAAVCCLVSFGPPAPGNIWETWLNPWEAGTNDWLQLLSTQPELSVYLVGDHGTGEASSRQLNPLAHFAGAAVARTKGLRPWSVTQFDQLREQVYRRWPDIASLWQGLGALPTSLVLVPPPGMPGGGSDAGVAEGALPAAELALRGIQEPIRSILTCLAPFGKAASFRCLAEYAQNLRRQPALRNLWLHLWDDALQQAIGRRLLRPHPADPEYLAVADEFTAAVRRRLEFVPPVARQAIEAAMYATYGEIAGAIGRGFLAADASQQQAARAAASLEYENLRTTLEYGLANGWNVSQIYPPLDAYLLQSGHFQRGVELGERMLAARGHMAGNETEGFCLLSNIAEHQRRLGQYDRAESNCRKALAICAGGAIAAGQQLDVHVGRVHENLGLIACDQRQWKRATECLHKALEISVQLGNRSKEATIHHHLARIAASEADWSRARGHSRKAMELFATQGNRLGEAAVLRRLGKLGGGERAAEGGRKVLSPGAGVRRGVRRQAGAGERSCRPGQRGAMAAAMESLRGTLPQGDQALLPDRRPPRPRRGLQRTRRLLAETGEIRKARQVHRRALKLNRAVHDRFEQGTTCRYLGHLAEQCRKWGHARATTTTGRWSATGDRKTRSTWRKSTWRSADLPTPAADGRRATSTSWRDCATRSLARTPRRGTAPWRRWRRRGEPPATARCRRLRRKSSTPRPARRRPCCETCCRKSEGRTPPRYWPVTSAMPESTASTISASCSSEIANGGQSTITSPSGRRRTPRRIAASHTRRPICSAAG